MFVATSVLLAIGYLSSQRRRQSTDGSMRFVGDAVVSVPTRTWVPVAVLPNSAVKALTAFAIDAKGNRTETKLNTFPRGAEHTAVFSAFPQTFDATVSKWPHGTERILFEMENSGNGGITEETVAASAPPSEVAVAIRRLCVRHCYGSGGRGGGTPPSSSTTGGVTSSSSATGGVTSSSLTTTDVKE